MTPEERFDRIESLIYRQSQETSRQSEEIDKQNAGIRDLVIVTRTIITSIQELQDLQRRNQEDWNAQMKDLRQAQTTTDEKLNILIDTVDRIIRHRNGKE